MKRKSWRDFKPLLPDRSGKVVKDIWMRMMLLTNWWFSFYWAVFALRQGCSSSSHCPARAGWGHKKLQGDPDRTGWSKAPRASCWAGKLEELDQGTVIAARGLAGHPLAVVKYPTVHHCFCIFFITIIIIFLSISVLLNWLFLNPWFLIFFFPILSPIQLGRTEGAALGCYKPQQHPILLRFSNSLWRTEERQEPPPPSGTSTSPSPCTAEEDQKDRKWLRGPFYHSLALPNHWLAPFRQ